MKLAFVYLTDEGGFELARHSAVSLAMSQNAPCDIHVFCYRFTPVVPPQFAAAMAALRATLWFHDINDTGLEQHPTCGHVTTPSLLKPSAVGRLATGDYDRIVYLDSDLLIFEDLAIADIDFGQTPIAAVIDMDLSDTGSLRRSKWAPGGGQEDVGGYFNNGFMVFNAQNWRGQEIAERYAAALDQHDIECQYKINCTSIDQCAMNSVFENNWTRLPATYNMQAGAKFTGAWKTAAVRHYCGRRKFIPVTAFRNDSRDVRYLNRIRHAMGLPGQKLPFLYEIPFQLNSARRLRSDWTIRRFLSAIQSHPLSVSGRSGSGRSGAGRPGPAMSGPTGSPAK